MSNFDLTAFCTKYLGKCGQNFMHAINLCGRAKVPCDKRDTGSYECHETFLSGSNIRSKKITCGDKVSGTWAQ